MSSLWYSRALRYAALRYAGLNGTRFWIGSKNFRDTRIWDFFLEKHGFLLRLNCKKYFLANRWNDGMAYRSYSTEATLQKLLYRSYSVVIHQTSVLLAICSINKVESIIVKSHFVLRSWMDDYKWTFTAEYSIGDPRYFLLAICHTNNSYIPW